MSLVDPVNIYAATSNTEAQMVCRLLHGQGIEAFPVEHNSPIGVWWGGILPKIYDAGVYVTRVDEEQALEILRQHKKLESKREDGAGELIETTCEECGEVVTFPSTQRGTVQDCPVCEELLDVPEDERLLGTE